MISFIKPLFYLGLCMLLFSLNACTAEKPIERPNIVWLTSEDNSIHYLKMYDESGVETPNIESLASEGIVFNNAFSNGAVCSVARSTIISGCYGPGAGSNYHRKQKMVPMPDGLEMFPAYLRQAGYYTGNNAKEDYNFFKSDSVWDMSSKKAHWRNRAEGQPFFYVQNFATTHESRLHFSKEVYMSHKTKFPVAEAEVFPTHPESDLFKYTNAYYRDKISQMDSELGKVLDELKKDGLMENTFVFYYGDHGGVLPGSKGYIYETGLHVPMVVYVPEKYKHLVDFEKGSRVDGFVSFVDLAPTILNLAGVKIPEGLVGKPFLGKNVDAEEVNSRDFTYSYADRFDEKSDFVRAIRKGKYKYMRNYQPFNYDGLWNAYRYKQLAYMEWKDLFEEDKLNKVQSAFFNSRKPEMLFNVEEDRFETFNLANNDDYNEVLVEMRSLYNQTEQEVTDLSFYPEFYLINNAFDNPKQFGLEHKEDLNRYRNIADLQLLSYQEAKTGIQKALNSKDSWDRYWGLIVCSSFGKEAKDFVSQIRKISKSDSEALNRVRAAEYFGLTKMDDPTKVMIEALYSTKDENEALQIMNSMTLMFDIHYEYDFDIDESKVAQEIKNDKTASLRLAYLLSK